MTSNTTATVKRPRVVIIGAIAGGATCAARIHRLDETIDVTLIDKTTEISRASCSLPYYFSSEVERKNMQLQTASGLEEILHQKILTDTTALKIDRANKTVTIAPNNDLTKTRTLSYDKLLLSPGAEPVYPPIPGILSDCKKAWNKVQGPASPFGQGLGDYSLPIYGIYCLQTLKDADRVNEYFKKPQVQKICVIGSGFIGVECVEAFRHAKFTDTVGRHYHKDVTLLEVGETILPAVCDPEIGRIANEALIENGVNLYCGIKINKIVQTDGNNNGLGLGFAIHHKENGKDEVIHADMVLLGTGIRPRSDLAKDAGLICGVRGHIRVNEYMQSQTDQDVYAVGDAIEHADQVFPQEYSAVALGNLANQEARVAADHIVASLYQNKDDQRENRQHRKTFEKTDLHPMPGFLGTAIVRVFNTTFACTGWTESRLKRFRPSTPYSVVNFTSKGGDHATYFPGAEFMTLKVIYDPNANGGGRILGAQGVGYNGVDKRIDIIATAIHGGLSIDQLACLQLCYSPMFGSARDTVNIVGLIARNQRQHLVKTTTDLWEFKKINAKHPGSAILIDVRLPHESQEGIIPDAIRIPFGKPLEEAIENEKIDKSKKIFVVCIIGRSSYFSARMLAQRGYDVTSVMGGVSVNFRPKAHLPNNQRGYSKL